MTCKVYRVTNVINNKLYIGITKERYLSHRFWAHANRGRSAGAYLHWSIQKHGKENFLMELLYEYDTPEEAKKKEVELIAELQLNRYRYPSGIGMNLTDGGDGSYGCKHRPESIEKMKGKNNHNYGLLGAKNPTSKAIQQYSLDGQYIQTFGSVREAARHINPDCTKMQITSLAGNIVSAAIGRNGTAQSHGYKWKYA